MNLQIVQWVALVAVAIIAIVGLFRPTSIEDRLITAEKNVAAIGAYLQARGEEPTVGGSRFPNGISVATTSVARQLNIGAGASATSTLSVGKPCFEVVTSNGTLLYYSPSSISTLGGWATSTTSCF